MHLNKTLLHLFFIFVAVLLITGSGCAPPVKQKEKETDTKQTVPEDDDKPKINLEGPQPKMVIAESEFQFGSMMVGERRKHTFIIKNEGEGVLELHIGPASCGKCSKFTLKETTVPPGGQTEVLAEWFPSELDENFRKYAPLTSNDSKNREVEIVVQGSVSEQLQLSSGSEWNLPSFQEGKPATLTSYIYSTVLDKFSVTEVKTDSLQMTVKSEKMTPAELKKHHAKSGHAIKVSISPKIPIGRITEQLVIKTDVNKKSEFSIIIKGTRSGPIRFQPFPGVVFHSEEMVIDMKRFSANKGRVGKLQFIIEETGETPFKIEKVKSDSGTLKVTVKEDEKFKVKKKRRFFLLLEVPSGSPLVNHTLGNMTKVVINTNHPDAKEIRLRVSFLTF